MKLLERYVDDRAVQSSDAATYRADLPAHTQISAIDLRFELTNGSSTGIQQILDALTTISVMDGGKPIFSVFPRVAAAITALVTKQRAPQVRTEVGSAVQEVFLRIPFGRYLGDEEYYLDTGRYANPQIRIPYAPTISSTRFATGTVTVTSVLHYWDPSDAPAGAKGYLRWIEAYQRSSGASGAVQYALPMDEPLLGIMVYAREVGIAIQTDLTRIRILDNIAGNEIRNYRTQDLMDQNHKRYGLEAIERGIAVRQDSGVIDTDCDFCQSAHLIVLATQTTSTDINAYALKSITGDELSLSGIKIADSAGTIGAAALDTTNRTLIWTAFGRGLPHSAYLAMAPWDDPSDQYPWPEGAKPQIELTDGGADDDEHITVLQLV